MAINYREFITAVKYDKTHHHYHFSYLDPNTNETVTVTDKKKNVVCSKKDEIKKLIREHLSRLKITPNVKPRRQKRNVSRNKMMIKELEKNAFELKIQGYGDERIIAELMSTYKLSLYEAERAVNKVFSDLGKEISEDFVRTMIFSHNNFYDELYKKFIDNNAPKLAIATLKSKERLNGIGQDIFELQMNNIFDAQSTTSYDLDKLTPAEQREFKKILAKINGGKDIHQ